jgi:hypothetical protein
MHRAARERRFRERPAGLSNLQNRFDSLRATATIGTTAAGDSRSGTPETRFEISGKVFVFTRVSFFI